MSLSSFAGVRGYHEYKAIWAASWCVIVSQTMIVTMYAVAVIMGHLLLIWSFFLGFLGLNHSPRPDFLPMTSWRSGSPSLSLKSSGEVTREQKWRRRLKCYDCHREVNC